jgi:starch phosphorylase
MKILVNGGINLSELDGWWAEAYGEDVGWALGDGQEHDEDTAWDKKEAEALYELLEQQVIPEFYHRDDHGISRKWVMRMRESMARLTPQFSTNRVVRQYTEKYYLPCTQRYLERATEGGKKGMELFQWNTKLCRHWGNLHFGDLCIETQNNHYLFLLPVYLGELDPDAVSIQLYAEPHGEMPAVCQMMDCSHALTGASNGFMFTGLVSADRPAGHYTPRAVAYHADAAVPLEAGHILWHG